MQSPSIFIIIDSIAIVCLVTGIVVSSLILLIILWKLTPHHTIAHLLLGNTCLCTLELCISFLISYGFILKNDATYDSSTNVTTSMTHDQRYLCPIRSYFVFTGFSLLYTSYCLQAYYRLRQVIFYRQRSNYRKFVYLILIQWLFSFLLILPMYLTNAFVYIPTEFFCPIPFTKPLSVAYIAVTVYGVFLVIFITIYLWIYIYASRTSTLTIQRRRLIDRQFTMLKRIILPTFSLMFLGVVYLTLFFQTLLNHYQTHYLTYRLSYLFIAVGMSFIHLITIHLTPPIKKVVVALFNRQLALVGRLIHENTMISAAAGVAPTFTQQQQQQQQPPQPRQQHHHQQQSNTTQIPLTTNVVAHPRGNRIEPVKETVDLTPVES